MALIYRKAVATDISKLAELHAKAWRETYEFLYPPDFIYPTKELREYQWNEAFKNLDGSWFCFVIENEAAELIGFAKGKKYNHENLPDFAGELNKIYLLRKYHKQGIGLKLLNKIVQEFLSLEINTMLLFSEPKNPTSKFFEALGAEKLYAQNGEFHGAYGWRNLAYLEKSIEKRMAKINLDLKS